MARLTNSDSSHAADGSPPRVSPRERILAAAKNLFYRSGINSVGVEAIAQSAATNKMTLYRHFGSKDDLILAYVSELAAEGDAVWEKIHADHPDDADQRITAWLDYVEEVLANRYDRGCALANAAVELQPEHPARSVIENHKKHKREVLVALFTAANYKDPETLSDEVFLLFEGARISLQCGGRGPASRVSKMLRDLLAAAPRNPA